MEVFVGTESLPYSGFLVDTVYSYVLSDQRTGQLVIEDVTTSSPTGTIDIPLPQDRFSHWFNLTVFNGSGSIVIDDSIDVVKPYVKGADVVAYMQGKVTLAEAVEYEAIVRYMIDAITGAPFRFEDKTVVRLGYGSDLLVFDERLIKVNSLSRNNVVEWYATDLDYQGIPGKFTPINHMYAMTFIPTDTQVNILEHASTWSTRYSFPIFTEGSEFRIDGHWGWPVVPEDIRRAALLMINDIVCGTTKYSTKYIDSFRNGNISVDYFKEVTKGTGNLIVDNILSKYTLESVRAKVL